MYELDYSGTMYEILMFSFREFHNLCNDNFVSYALSWTK